MGLGYEPGKFCHMDEIWLVTDVSSASLCQAPVSLIKGFLCASVCVWVFPFSFSPSPFALWFRLGNCPSLKALFELALCSCCPGAGRNEAFQRQSVVIET